MKRQVKLTREEKTIEEALIKGEFIDLRSKDFKEIADSIKMRQKDSVLNIRLNSGDLKMLKQKASRLGVKYQSFISEVLHKVAHS